MINKLSILCGLDKNDKRGHVNTPWFKDGISYSTNGKVLLRIVGEFGTSYNDGKFPEIDDVFDFKELEKAINGIKIDIKWFNERKKQNLCEYCDPKVKENPKYCMECDGEGFLTLNSDYNEYEVDCKSCDGEGYEEGKFTTKDCPYCFGSRWNYNYDKSNAWKISDRLFDPRFISILLNNLDGLEFYPNVFICTNGLGFKFNCGMGVIMEIKQ